MIEFGTMLTGLEPCFHGILRFPREAQIDHFLPKKSQDSAYLHCPPLPGSGSPPTLRGYLRQT